MPLPEKVKEAVDVINAYREELSKKVCKTSYTCIVCQTKELKLLRSERIDPLKQELAWWANGQVDRVDFGYGSNYDTASFYIGICDDCITKAIEKGLIVRYEDLIKEVRKFDENHELSMR
jgi:hypothetical protein